MELLRTLGSAESGGWGLGALGNPPPPPLLKADQVSKFLKSRNGDDWTLLPSPACTATILCTCPPTRSHLCAIVLSRVQKRSVGLLPWLTPAHPFKKRPTSSSLPDPKLCTSPIVFLAPISLI